MDNQKIKLKLYKGIKGRLAVIGSVVFLIMPAIIYAVITNSPLPLLISIPGFVMGILGGLSAAVLCVKVNGNEIKSHTQLFKKSHTFNVSEIQTITFSKQNTSETYGRYGSVYCMKITANSKLCEVFSCWGGFTEFAEYLLQKYESGEIPQTALSDRNLKKLKSSAKRNEE